MEHPDATDMSTSKSVETVMSKDLQLLYFLLAEAVS